MIDQQVLHSPALATARACSTLRRLALSAGLLVALLGCSSDQDSQDTYDSSSDTEFVIRYMQDWYLWEDRLPNEINEQDYASGQAALDALRVSEDTFSNISPAVEYNRFFDEGKTIGFGFSYRIQDDNKSIRIYMVQPNAPAAAAGLLRGDLIEQIDNETVETLIAQNRLNDAFGAVEEGITRSFAIKRQDENVTLTITKALYVLSYVLADSVFESNGRLVGYVNFFSFADKGVTPWREALDRLLADGAQDLIVDLRSNGGGLLSTTVQIGSALGGNSLEGKVLTKLSFNDKHQSSDRTYLFNADSRSGRFERLVWLTSRSSCSASEALIVGLDPHRTATRIGERTCGKPVGFTPPGFDNKVYSIVSFRLENANGVTDYFDGLEPNCTVKDDGAGQLGSSDETLTAAALTYLATGSCPATAAATKGAPDNRSLDEQTNRAQGMPQLTNLW